MVAADRTSGHLGLVHRIRTLCLGGGLVGLADSSGYTKRKAMEKENAKKQARIDKNKEAIGTLTTRRKR